MNQTWITIVFLKYTSFSVFKKKLRNANFANVH